MNGFDLVEINLNSSMGNHVAQKFLGPYTKRAFGGI